MKKNVVYTFIVIMILHIATIPNSFGHGLSSETLPPVKVGNTEVALFAQILPNPFIEGKQLGWNYWIHLLASQHQKPLTT